MPGSDTQTFSAADGTATDDEVRLSAGERLVAASVTLPAGTASVHVRGSLNYGTHGHVLFRGWLRGLSTGGSGQALWWTGDFLLPKGIPTIGISVRNDTGAAVDVTYNWVVVK